MLFSGGLDSLAGALDEIVNQKNRVVLVSHQSATKLQPVQKDLAGKLGETADQRRVLHIPVTMHLRQGGNRENTHRSRSFFFAALCATLARMFRLETARFYENGVVSMNLPISAQVVGARATRSTHPQVLAGLSSLFSALFEDRFQVDNPFRWKTKTEVVQLINHLGARNLIRQTRSCGEIYKSTKDHPQCGLCSQCIDRRFAMLAADLGDEDPIGSYAVDPLSGPRTNSPDREMALGYANNARCFATMSPADFASQFGEIQRVVGFLDEPAHAAAERAFTLHQRHGAAVMRVLKREIQLVASGEAAGKHDPDSLVMLAGQALFDGRPAPAPIPTTLTKADETWQLIVAGRQVTVDGLGVVKEVGARVLIELAELHLEALGKGLAAEDHPFLPAVTLAERWRIDEEAVRQRFRRLRRSLGRLAQENGIDPPDINGIVENVPWRGYRLNPDSVRVRMATTAGN